MAKITAAGTKRTLQDQTREARQFAAENEGALGLELLRSNGYSVKLKRDGEAATSCPFHEGPDKRVKAGKENFFYNTTSGLFACHSASCGERGNVRSLQRHFGFDDSDTHFVSREQQLRGFEEALTESRRSVFYRQGLSDATIERFRYGYDERNRRWVIPYLEGRRPMLFRYYNPEATGDELKYYWESGSSARLYNPSGATGDDKGRVIIAESELKAAVLCQLGYSAVGVPGAGMFKTEWHKQFNDAKRIYVVFDSDDPDRHIYENCNRCGEFCLGHNPGQEAAVRLVEQLGWRAKNIVLPRPEGERKCDINEYLTRDGHTGEDFAQLAFGEKKTPLRVSTLADIMAAPPPEAQWLIDGILPKGARMLITGAPKTGKSLLLEELLLAMSSGEQWLWRYPCEKSRVLLLDRELSKRSLFDRLSGMIEKRPSLKAGIDSLCIDHDVRVRLDDPEVFDTLVGLVEMNGVDAIAFDTAYKFFGHSFQDASVAKGFDVLDRLISETGVSVIITHHHRKKSGGEKNQGRSEQDDVAGSFLWTGWPNGTVQLSFAQRSLADPWSNVVSFNAFRDAIPPAPVVIHRNPETGAYEGVSDWREDDDPNTSSSPRPTGRVSRDDVGTLLIQLQPTFEDDFIQTAIGNLGGSETMIKHMILDLVDEGVFTRTSVGSGHVLRWAGEMPEEETWEQEHGMASLPLPDMASSPEYS